VGRAADTALMAHNFDIEELKKFLAGSVLFEGADDAGLELLVNQLEPIRLKKGDPIVLENEISDHVYFIYSGSAEVVKHLPELNKMHRLAVLKKGSQFSEFSVLNRARKGASVFALEDSDVLRMSAQSFMHALGQLPIVAKTLAQHIAKMSRHYQVSRLRFQYLNETKVNVHPRIMQILPPNTWQKFKALPICLDGNGLFVAVRNPANRELYEFLKNSQPHLRVKVSLINDEDFMALGKQLLAVYQSNNVPLPGKTELPAALVGTPEEWLPKISLFKDMPAEWLTQVAPHVQYVEIPAGKVIFDKDQASERMFILVSGVVDVSLPLGLANAELHQGEVLPGEYFAEISLLTDNPHTLCARAKSDVKLAYLNKSDFQNLLETPVFTLPLARDLAIQFQENTSVETFEVFDVTQKVQVEDLAPLIPKSILAQYEIMPLTLNDDEITVGITNPESETIYSVISRYLQDYRVKLEIIHPQDFKTWFALIDNSVKGASTVVGRQGSVNSAKINPVEALNKLLAYGYDHNASDVHIEPQADSFIVRFRIDGVLNEYPEKYSVQVGTEMLNRIKIVSKLDTTNHMTPQDGQLNLEYAGRQMVARTSILPTKLGENAVLRLIRSRSSVPPLATLAADLRVVNILRKIVASSQGVFLVTGPTGSGKSTTLYSLLEALNKVEVSIISLEDPVELTVAGTTQVEMNEKQGLTFASALRSALRQDPDVIMIGEIRDEESAKIAFHAAATGHLVISTLHTNDSLSVVPRLLEMGITRQALGATLLGASAQRLVREICSKCISQRPINESELTLIKNEIPNTTPPEQVSFGAGCVACNNTGYKGRVPIMEVWTKTKSLETALLEGRSIDQFNEEVYKTDFETLRQFALRMACAGRTTFEEVESRFGGLLVSSKAA